MRDADYFYQSIPVALTHQTLSDAFFDFTCLIFRKRIAVQVRGFGYYSPIRHVRVCDIQRKAFQYQTTCRSHKKGTGYPVRRGE